MTKLFFSEILSDRSRTGRRTFLYGILTLILWGTVLFASVASLDAAQYRTANFIVTASTPEFAQKVGECAEENRARLALLWLGTPIQQWSSPCPISVKSGPDLGAGGETSFTFKENEVFGWKMTVQGSEDRILDSVIPHEVSHTIFATYFRRPVPRWIDEGAATMMEADVERNNYRRMLIGYLQERKGIPFNRMVSLKEYPSDMLPFYSQGFSVCEYLIAVGGHRRLVEFARQGTTTGDWSAAVNQFYGYKDLSELQVKWTDWISEWFHHGQRGELPAVAKVPDYPLDIYGREINPRTVAALNHQPNPLIASSPSVIRGQSETSGTMDSSPSRRSLLSGPQGDSNPLPGGNEHPAILRPRREGNFAATPSSSSERNPLTMTEVYESFQKGVGTASPSDGTFDSSSEERLVTMENNASASNQADGKLLQYRGSYGRREMSGADSTTTSITEKEGRESSLKNSPIFSIAPPLF